mgnify:CR=1 FL=1
MLSPAGTSLEGPLWRQSAGQPPLPPSQIPPPLPALQYLCSTTVAPQLYVSPSQENLLGTLHTSVRGGGAVREGGREGASQEQLSVVRVG